MRSVHWLVISTAALAVIVAGCAKKHDGDPGKQLQLITRSMLEIVKDNVGDCSKIVPALEQFRKANEQKIKELRKRDEELAKSLPPAEKTKYAEKMKQSMKETYDMALSVIMEVNRKCPGQASKIADLLRMK
ncbi:MAG: hypothetical protein D6806_02190 [Deltaproteobacteria bacterium]|nr:MAG: hypothetical protein D6806_02190 [Deltaproteobacteria bacterium]